MKAKMMATGGMSKKGYAVGGAVGMHKMPDGKMMKDSDMAKGGAVKAKMAVGGGVMKKKMAVGGGVMKPAAKKAK